jgi:hypothetical protein
MLEKIEAWFKNSLTILWARVQYIGGVLAAGLIVAFSGYDFTKLTTLTKEDAIKMLVAVAAAGIMTELARRRTL